MKIGFLSVCTMLFALYGTDCSAYIAEKSSHVAPLPMKQLAKENPQDQQGYVIKCGSFRDERSFADVVKGVKKSDTPTDKKKSKKEKKSKKRPEEFLQLNLNLNKDCVWKSKKNEASGFCKKRQSARNGINKKHQSSHKGILYRSR